MAAGIFPMVPGHEIVGRVAKVGDPAGVMVCVGIPTQPLSVPPFSLIAGRRSVGGSGIGGIAETQEMLDYCAAHKITADVEVIPIQQINEAYERVIKGQVKYRFVIDIASLKRGEGTTDPLPAFSSRRSAAVRSTLLAMGRELLAQSNQHALDPLRFRLEVVLTANAREWVRMRCLRSRWVSLVGPRGACPEPSRRAGAAVVGRAALRRGHGHAAATPKAGKRVPTTCGRLQFAKVLHLFLSPQPTAHSPQKKEKGVTSHMS